MSVSSCKLNRNIDDFACTELFKQQESPSLSPPLKQERRITLSQILDNAPSIIVSWTPGKHHFTVIYPPDYAGKEIHFNDPISQ